MGIWAGSEVRHESSKVNDFFDLLTHAHHRLHNFVSFGFAESLLLTVTQQAV